MMRFRGDGQGMKGVDGLPCHHVRGCVRGHVVHLCMTRKYLSLAYVHAQS